MKTKHIIKALICVVPALINTAIAQSPYAGVVLGYGMAAAKHEVGYDRTTTKTGTTTTSDYKSRSYSLGKGMQVGVFGGVMLNDNIGAELGINYLIGGKTTVKTEDSGPGYSNTTEDGWRASTIRIIPAMKLSVGKGKLRGRTKAGLIIALGTKVINTSENNSVNTTTTTSFSSEWHYTGGISLGFHGAAGVDFFVNDHLAVFAELAGYFQSYSPKKAELVKSETNGIDNLANVKTKFKETEYVKSYTQVSNDPSNVDSPDKQLKDYMPLSSIGLNVGVTFKFGSGGKSASVLSPAFE
jgi:hypothetical protein